MEKTQTITLANERDCVHTDKDIRHTLGIVSICVTSFFLDQLLLILMYAFWIPTLDFRKRFEPISLLLVGSERCSMRFV